LYSSSEEARKQVFKKLAHFIEEFSYGDWHGASAVDVEVALLSALPSCFSDVGATSFRQVLFCARAEGVPLKYEEEGGRVTRLRLTDREGTTGRATSGELR